MVALSTDPAVLRREGEEGERGRRLIRRMGAAASGSGLMMSNWGGSSSSSRSIKVFANYHHLKNNNNNNKKKRSQQQQAETISSRNMIMINNNENNKDNKHKKMKMMMMLNRCSNAYSNAEEGDSISNNIVSIALDDDFVITEILSRLPVKTLMRFKSVSKRWSYSIHHDPQFHQLHYNHSETRLPLLRSFNISAIRGSGFKTITGYHVSDANSINGAAYHTFQQWAKLFSVHGLVCLVDLPGDALRIYNPSTRQETQWINIPTEISRIVFGFDPVTKKHKVLCRLDTKPAATSHVLTVTVGENSWRRIDHDHHVPNDNLYEGPCVYLNGTIYWMEKFPRKKGQKKKQQPDSGAPQVLVAFDVGSEKFRVIQIPDFIINQPRDESYWYVHKSRGPFTDHLLEVNGRVALLRRKNKNTVSMWMLFEDDADHNRNWTEVVITLPFDWVGEETTVRFDNVPGTDQIIVISRIDRVRTAYSHNWKENTSEKLEFTGGLEFATIYDRLPSRDRSQIEIEYQHTHFRESLYPVN